MMNAFTVGFDYIGDAPAKSTLEVWIRETYSNVKAINNVSFKVTTSDSEENFTANMQNVLKRRYAGGTLTGMTVE